MSKLSSTLTASIVLVALVGLVHASAWAAGAPGSITVTSPDQKMVATGEGKTISYYDAASGKILVRIEGHTGKVTALVFTPDGKSLVSGSADKTINIWDAATGKQLLSLRGHAAGVTALSVSKNGKTLTSTAADKGTIVWDVATGKVVKKEKGQ